MERAEADSQKSKNEKRKSNRDGLVSASTLLLGALTVAFLTRYNLSIYTVWSTGPNRPYRTWEEYLVVNTTGLLLPPLLLIFGLFREEAADFGLRRPRPGAARPAALFFLGMLPLMLIASRLPSFQAYYPLQPQAAEDWGYFFYFEISYGFYLFCWEFFYRGFLTFGLARAFGEPAAIALQSFAFGLMHYGKPAPEMAGSFVAGAALGWLALRGCSFLPCFAVHWAVAFCFDLLILWARPGGLL